MPALETVADGRVFTGRQAVELKLVDELGDEQAAIDWLAKEKKHRSRRRRCATGSSSPRFGDLSFLHLAALALLDAVGLNGLAAALRGVRRRPGGRAAQP